MSIRTVTKESFEEWSYHPVTRKLMSALKEDRESMKEGLVQGLFENEEEVKGRCKALQLILDLEYEDLVQTNRE